MIKVSAKAQIGYRYDAIARLLARTLTVPAIFFEAAWPDASKHVDILAVDRAGSGDLHVIELKSLAKDVTTSLTRQVAAIPAHYRWIAIPLDGTSEQSSVSLASKLVEVGIGLIGVARVGHDKTSANVISKPTRAASFDRTQVGDFLNRTVPDIEYGEAPAASTHQEKLLLSSANVKKYLDEADQLLALGHERAAYLLAWSAIEAAMQIVLGSDRQAPMHGPGTLVRAIRESGRVNSSEAKALGDALAIRNALVHGLDGPPSTNKAFRSITAIGRKLIEPQAIKPKRGRRQIA